MFEKLLTRNIPKLVVRLLIFWYTQQQFCAKWENIVSDFFTVSNGVRQGGVLSPYLFNVYMDDLSDEMNSSQVGCLYNNVLINHLMYADDIVLMTPSANSLQTLLTICEKYAIKCSINFNLKKSVYMCIKPRNVSNMIVPIVFLNGSPLSIVAKQKYLGNILTSEYKDDDSILSQVKSTYARGNMLVKHFRECSDEVKCSLFKTYCYNFYCCQLWSYYKKQSICKLRVAYNSVFRKLFKLDNHVSMSQTFAERGIDHLSVIIRKCIFSFLRRIELSPNTLVQCVADSLLFRSSHLFKVWSKQLF